MCCSFRMYGVCMRKLPDKIEKTENSDTSNETVMQKQNDTKKCQSKDGETEKNRPKVTVQIKQK